MNSRVVLFVVVAVAFLVVVGLTLEGIISLAIGIILAVIIFIGPILLTALFTVFFTNALASKPKLEIKNAKFVKKYPNIEGYQLRATILNTRKKMCLDLEAKLQIRDANDKSPNLLTVLRDSGAITTKEEEMREVKYGWIDEKGKKAESTMWKELRYKDSIDLLYPLKSFFFGHGVRSTIDGPFRNQSFGSEVLLKLVDGVRYNVVIEVKGEDSEKNTVMKTQKFSLSI